MRQAFITTLTELARGDKRIFLLTGDLGFSVFEKFQEEFPDRFFNMGVAEANMIGVAAGLALSHKIVFVYSIIPFLIMRPLEQIRNDLCYQGLKVRLVGVGGGLSYGSAGPTHHAITDIALMRSLPGMTVVCPGDPLETEWTIKQSLSYEGPMYIRLGRAGEPKVHSKILDFKIGKGILLKEGKEITLIATGNMLYTAYQVAQRLTKEGKGVRLISMPTIKPLDKEILLAAFKETKAIFTIEEHSLVGGLGSAVAEVLAESGNQNILFRRFGLEDAFCYQVGSQEYLRQAKGLSIDEIIKTICRNLSHTPGLIKEDEVG